MARSRPKAPTILDIAAEAGVSKSAVSRALLGQGEVSAQTRARIEAAAKKLGYVANAMAQGLVRSSTHMLGVVLRDVTRPFYAYLLAGMQQEAERRGYRVVTMTSAGDLEVDDALRAFEALVSLQVDGLVLASARLPSEDVVPFMDRVPIVVAGRRESQHGITSAFCDDTGGGRLLAEHLIDLGHRRVAVALVDRDYSLSQHTRGQGMLARLRERGVETEVWHLADDREAAQVTSERLDPTGVTAIMCPTDAAALEVLDVLRTRDLRVPDDVSVTGYDGIGPYASEHIGLTTFRQPVREIGRTAISLLVDKLEGIAGEDRLVELAGSLAPGRTAGAPAHD